MINVAAPKLTNAQLRTLHKIQVAGSDGLYHRDLPFRTLWRVLLEQQLVVLSHVDEMVRITRRGHTALARAAREGWSPDYVEELGKILDKVEARVTIDADRNMTHPCIRCRTIKLPRILTVVGYWSRDVSGGMKAGDPILRPLCEGCDQETQGSSRSPSWPARAV